MSDLIDSINRLRNENPEVSSALKRARDGQASADPREESNYYHSAPSMSATAQSSGGDTKNFLEGRDRDRDSMGVNNWVHKHRDEIAAGDTDRLAKRLEAEQNFANAQNAIEGFKRDSAQGLPCPGTAILSAGDPGGISVQPDINRPAPSNRYELPHSSVYSQPVRSLLNESTGVNNLSSVSPGGRGTLASRYSPSNNANNNYNSRYGNSNNNNNRSSSYGSDNNNNNNRSNNDDVVLDTKTRFGDIDESSNYESKRKLLNGKGGGSSLADRVSQSLQPQHMPSNEGSSHNRMPISNALAAWSRAHPGEAADRSGSGLNAPLTAAVRTAASNVEPDSQSIRALMDTIGIRDATIARLESQIREERRFHESAMSEIKAENETLKETLRRYNADTDKKVEEITNGASAEVRAAKEQHARELDQAKIRFDQRVKAVEDDMHKSLQAAKSNFENQLARVDDLHDASATQFRDTLRTERSEALNREKTSLVELLAREQEALLRDGEQRILSDLSRQLSERARTELQRLVQQQTTEVLLPSLKELVTRDVVRAISDRATSAAEQHVEDRSRAMRKELEVILADGEKRLEDSASRLAASSVVRWSGVVPLIEGGTGNVDGVAAFKHHAELMRKLQEDADRLLKEQRDRDHDHAQKITGLKSHLEELQSELNSQKQINEALAERLVSNK